MLPSLYDIGDYEDMMRTDKNNNPAAFTTDVAKEAGLVEHTDYEQGDPFTDKNHTYYTAKLLGDPIEITIRVIDKIGYYSHWGSRWTYIAIPTFLWHSFDHDTKRDVIGFHYQHEGGIELKHLFPNYGRS